MARNACDRCGCTYEECECTRESRGPHMASLQSHRTIRVRKTATGWEHKDVTPPVQPRLPGL